MCLRISISSGTANWPGSNLGPCTSCASLSCAIRAKLGALDGTLAARGAHWFSSDSQVRAGGSLARGDSLQVSNDGGALLRVSPDLTVRRGHDISHDVKDRLMASDLNLSDVTVHLEPEEDL